MTKAIIIIPLLCILTACGNGSPEKNSQAESAKSAKNVETAAPSKEGLIEPRNMQEYKVQAKAACLADGQGAAYCDCLVEVSAEFAEKDVGGGGVDPSKVDEKLSKCDPMKAPSN